MSVLYKALYRLAAPVSLLSPAGTLFPLVPANSSQTDGRFIPQFCYVHLRSRTGTATTGATIRVGTNATHDNVAPSFTAPPGAAVGVIASLALASPLKAPLIETTAILLELVSPAIGPSEMTGDIVIEGILIG